MLLIASVYFADYYVGMLTLSPMTVAPVCHVGDPLSITCNASIQFITWSIFQVNEQGALVMVTTDVNINSRDANQMGQRQVNSATFTFMRSSAPGLPLISTLSIDSVNIDLNGIVIRCTDKQNSVTSDSTSINIIDIINSKLLLALITFLCTFFYAFDL